jgi:hypothetical protein
MLVAWIALVARAVGRDPLGRRTAAVRFALLVVPIATAPLVALRGTTLGAYREHFTDVMRWGIVPAVAVVLVLLVRAVAAARRDGTLPVSPLRDPRVACVAASAAMTLTGFGLGAAIRGSSTLVPGHYHAAIGAVTVSFMALAYPLLARVADGATFGAGARTRLGRVAPWQPLLFGAGQLVFAIGFSIAGAHGMARKVYGAEQHVRSLGEWAGLVVMGVGGLFAVAGGVLFLVIAIGALARRARVPEGGIEWKAARPIRSNG